MVAILEQFQQTGAADWTTLANIPVGFQDNVDNDTNLDEAAVDAFVAGNNGFITAELDDNPTNGIQNLTIAGNDLYISGGNTVTIPTAGAADWTTLANIPVGFQDNVDNDTQIHCRGGTYTYRN